MNTEFGLAPVVVAIFMAWAPSAFAADPATADADFFEKKVRPVLVEHCYECHSADAKTLQGSLRLDSREGFLKGGDTGPAIVPGAADQSLLIEAVKYESLEMPPKGKLPDEVIADLEHWVNQGAYDPRSDRPNSSEITQAEASKLWSLRPIEMPPLPQVREIERVQAPLDRFVIARLEESGINLSPPAERRALLKRTYFDLIGIPPTLDEIEAFENDSSADAFARIVDRLLASPMYGERWGRHWLDVARYADTKDGVLMYGDDRIRPFAYTYRDYVIRAWNEDLPFDRFIHEQLAADVIEPKVEPWRLSALGFLTLGRMFDNNVHDVIDDQIDVVGRGLLGLTIACARCHDHKYDPITQADYYALYGVFASSEVPLDPPRIDASSYPDRDSFEQEITAKRQEIRNFIDTQYAELSETARRRVGDYLLRVVTTKPDPLETAIYFLSLAPEDLRPPITARWRRLFEQRSNSQDPVFAPWSEFLALNDEQWSDLSTVEAIRSKWIAHPRGTTAGQINPLVAEWLGQASITCAADLARGYGDLLLRMYDESKQTDFAADPLVDAKRQLLDLIAGPFSPAYFPQSQTWNYLSRKDKDAYGGKLNELDRMAVQNVHAAPRAMIVVDSQQMNEPRIFLRGNSARPGDPVARRFLATLGGSDASPFQHGSGRLDLAQAITAPHNPLTGRVIVNRIWMHHFGEPLVSSLSDFGSRSTPPVHEPLLNFLAASLQQQGWSIKKLHRQILLSSTYQQGSADRPECRAIDPENRLLWRMNRRRLDLEAMRDGVLSISHRIDPRLGGRPVDIVNEPACGRRTVYGLVDRQSLPGLFRSFDFASPDQTAERRPFTTTPQQALFALNSPFVIEQTKALVARSEVVQAETTAARVAEIFRIVLQRDPDPTEVTAAEQFIAAAEQSTSQGSTSQLNAFEQFAQVLLISNEFMFVD